MGAEMCLFLFINYLQKGKKMFGKYILGLDLGKQNDYSVLTLVEPMLSESPVYRVPFIYRYPLKTSYVYVVKHVCEFIKSTKIDGDCMLVVDHTGVGAPVIDLFRENEVVPIGLTITGGNKANWSGARTVSVPKSELISSLQVAIQSKKIKIAHNLFEKEAFIKEMISFNATISSSGKGSFSAESGKHDDIVLSLAMAVWYADHRLRKAKRVILLGGY